MTYTTALHEIADDLDHLADTMHEQDDFGLPGDFENQSIREWLTEMATRVRDTAGTPPIVPALSSWSDVVGTLRHAQETTDRATLCQHFKAAADLIESYPPDLTDLTPNEVNELRDDLAAAHDALERLSPIVAGVNQYIAAENARAYVSKTVR